MRIVIDLQGAQSESRFRGIGRYSLSLTKAIIQSRGNHEIVIALSGLFPNTIMPLRYDLEKLLPKENIRVWYAPGPVKECEAGNEGRRKIAELLREAFLASLQPDVILITSLFEGYMDDAVTSIGRFDHNTKTAVILYDLIPFFNPDIYLPAQFQKDHYFQKINFVQKADLLLSISENAGREAAINLDFPKNNIINISSAVSSQFTPAPVSENQTAVIKKRYHIQREIVLYAPGGFDIRKNFENLIKAYAHLPKKIRDRHQLVIVSKIDDGNRLNLLKVAKKAGLKKNELILTGYVPDEDLIALYRMAKLFVFPSIHEEFGLPVLEALSCGAPVIGANTTSIPEVIGLDDALFDPLDVSSITAKILQALTDKYFRTYLCEHGLQQAKKFSWDESAAQLLLSLESLCKFSLNRRNSFLPAKFKPKLAFVSPMPPERTGIADYSAELLPALAEYYNIVVVTDQADVAVPWNHDLIKIRDETWLRSHVNEIDRILYQFGNSPFHKHMLQLIEDLPGIVVLHDFFLSSLMAWLEILGDESNAWSRALYKSHGYCAIKNRYLEPELTKQRYPANFKVLQHAQGVIVHSDFSRELACKWYGEQIASDWEKISLLRKPAEKNTKQIKNNIRNLLKIGEDDFVICSFGFLNPSKLNHRLLESWLASSLSMRKDCWLIFAGENCGGDYGANLMETIKKSGRANRIRITGFVSLQLFRQYLKITDIAVQLRTDSRGETSAALYDCMNYGIPLIVNAHGSMSELDTKAVWLLPDEFDNAELVQAMETLFQKPDRRQAMGECARSIILEKHTPEKCALNYAEAIERFYLQGKTCVNALISAIAKEKKHTPENIDLKQLARCIAISLPLDPPAKNFFLDITATRRNDLKTGIERVTRAILLSLLENSPLGYRIEPVYLKETNGTWHYFYARQYTLGLLNLDPNILKDEPIEPRCGDVLLGLDLSGDILVQAERSGLFKNINSLGVSLYCIVFDLLPVLIPDVFPPGAEKNHSQWLQVVSKFDGAICISQSVANDLTGWYAKNREYLKQKQLQIKWFHLGADVKNSVPSLGFPDNGESLLKKISALPCFLMVGTIEPRKAYLQTLKAFDCLWSEKKEINLVIVGKEGWKDLPKNMRRDIPRTVEYLHNHPQKDKHLFWLEGISDEYLEKIYEVSTCLIAASYGEGFGLPLIEAAQHKLPIIARDIPVFREVAGEHAYYFDAQTPKDMAQTVKAWLYLYQKNQHPSSNEMPWLTWKQSADKLVRLLCDTV